MKRHKLYIYNRLHILLHAAEDRESYREIVNTVRGVDEHYGHDQRRRDIVFKLDLYYRSHLFEVK